MIYCDTTAVEAMRTLSGRFSRGETTMDEFTVGCRRINDMTDRRKIEAQAARDNLVFLRARMTSLTNLQNAIIHEEIQAKKLTELAVQQQKLIESLNDARKNKEAALKAFSESAKLIDAPVQTVAQSNAITTVLCSNPVCRKPTPKSIDGLWRTYCSMTCDPAFNPLPPCGLSGCDCGLIIKQSAPIAVPATAPIAAPVAAPVALPVTATARPARPIKYCDSKVCSGRVIQPVTRGDLTGREFCSVQCAMGAHPTMH